MNLVLLMPLGLFALLALALPLLIHLTRRQRLTDTPFAALQWISRQLQPRRRLRFERPWLLLLRLLLLALLALLLARPVLDVPQGADAGAWILVAPGADLASAKTRVAAAGEWHWLAPGFPRVDAAQPPAATPTASLLRELDARLGAGARLRVVVPEELGGLDGQRLQLAHALDWIIVPGVSPAPPTAAAQPSVLHVRYAPDHSDALAWLRAAVAAWNVSGSGHYTLDARSQSQPLPDDARWLVWLGGPVPAEIPTWIERGGVALITRDQRKDAAVLWRDGAGKVVARQAAQGRGRVIALSGALSPADLPMLADARFPARLLAAFAGPMSAPDRAPADAVEPGHDATGPRIDGRDFTRDARPLDAWLAWLAAIAFLLERLLATRHPDEDAS